jgi:hypothetical protein
VHVHQALAFAPVQQRRGLVAVAVLGELFCRSYCPKMSVRFVWVMIFSPRVLFKNTVLQIQQDNGITAKLGANLTNKKCSQGNEQLLCVCLMYTCSETGKNSSSVFAVIKSGAVPLLRITSRTECIIAALEEIWVVRSGAE